MTSNSNKIALTKTYCFRKQKIRLHQPDRGYWKIRFYYTEAWLTLKKLSKKIEKISAN